MKAHPLHQTSPPKQGTWSAYASKTKMMQQGSEIGFRAPALRNSKLKKRNVQNQTWKKTEVRAMLYPTRSKEKSPSAATTTPAAVNITERVT